MTQGQFICDRPQQINECTVNTGLCKTDSYISDIDRYISNNTPCIPGMCGSSRKSALVAYPEHLQLYINNASFRSFQKECVSTDRYCYFTAQLDNFSLRGRWGGAQKW